MPSRFPETGFPPLIAFDPMSAFWTAWLQGAQIGGAIMATWAGMMRAAPAGAMTVNFPFANGFTQDIDPRTNWGWIGATAFPALEADILRQGASYGSQIGRMMDLLIDIAEKTPDADPAKLAELRSLKGRIDRIKENHGRDRDHV
ncbi:MAG TPA: hypothetical protein VLA52_11845 [Thermohalobaculum sp.]|nr:hypothetical protein [Thermohalobaculum sp.]